MVGTRRDEQNERAMRPLGHFQNPNSVITDVKSWWIFHSNVNAACGQCVETNFSRPSECIFYNTSHCMHISVQVLCSIVWFRISTVNNPAPLWP